MALEDLSEGTLMAAAGSTSFVRGQDYVRRVRDLRVTQTGAAASIQGSAVYLVDLRWGPTQVSGHCTCPHHAAGNFCKHLVALGLAVLDAGEVPRERAGDGGQGFQPPETGDSWHGSGASDSGRSVENRRALALGEEAHIPERLVDVVNRTLRVGHVDYDRSFEVADDIQQVLDELEELVEAGSTRVTQPALLRAVTRLRTVTERADDSGGVLGEACQRAALLYARACSAGHEDPSKLARWLLKFRDTSPGWPDLELSDFVAAFDDKALGIYRSGVERRQAELAHGGPLQRHELDRMRLELADHDGDLDAAIAILSTDGQSTQYAAIVDRLRAAGRHVEASAWIDSSVAAGRVSHQAGHANPFWLDANDVAEDLLARGLEDAAVGVLRAQISRATDIRPYRDLVQLAERLGRGDSEQAWARERLRSRAEEPFGSGALLVQIELADGDIAGAWTVADELGAGHAWEALVDASTKAFPARAARVLRGRVASDLRMTDSTRYPGIAATLVRIRDLMVRAGEQDDFAAYVVDLRETYHRRPALMAALARRGLL